MDLRLRGCAAVLFALALAAPSSALMIDNFNEGLISLVDSDSEPGPSFQQNAGLGSANTIGGVRHTTATAGGVPLVGIPGTASVVSVIGPLGTASVTALISGSYNLFYDGIDDEVANTTDGGLFLDLTSQDAFVVNLVNLTATAAEMRITLWDGNSGSNSPFMTPVTGVNTIPFTAFSGIDFDDIRAIRLNITEVNNLGEIVINDFYAVPEPGTALLLGIGLAGLASRRRGAH